MITELFIKQCEQAEEIQKLWKTENGDWVYWKVTKSIKIITDHFFTESFKDFIWLPTQEQLQEILKDVSFHIWGDFDHLYITSAVDYHRRNAYQINDVNSMNELWLAFVMHECYNKVWLKGRWVKSENR